MSLLNTSLVKKQSPLKDAARIYTAHEVGRLGSRRISRYAHLGAGKMADVAKVDLGTAVIIGVDELMGDDLGHVVRVIDVVGTEHNLHERRCSV